MELMKFDHIALKSNNIERSIKWYSKKWNAKILYQDETWGLIELSGIKIAFVTPTQHPAHICFEVNDEFIFRNLNKKTFKPHRDGSSSCYVRDLDGNFLEFLYWPQSEVKNDNV
jgi:catechol 2,3-dioxygenase-like lactoylglutathione lyase family enzyme